MNPSRCCMHGETMVCRSRLDCHRRCGIGHGAGPGTIPAPPPRATAAEKGWFLVAAILFFAIAVSAQLLGAALS